MTTWASGDPVRVGQIGLIRKLRFVTPARALIDVALATVIQVKGLAPDGTASTETAAFTTDGSDGFIQHKDLVGTYAGTAGDWKYWGRAEFADGSVFITAPLTYPVETEGQG